LNRQPQDLAPEGRRETSCLSTAAEITAVKATRPNGALRTSLQLFVRWVGVADFPIRFERKEYTDIFRKNHIAFDFGPSTQGSRCIPFIFSFFR
jgi:hypothetical protein